MELLRRGTFDHPADFCTWEVAYNDGTIDREAEKQYAGIDRNKFKTFRLVGPNAEMLFEIGLPDNATGHNFVFRRRTSLLNGARAQVLLIAGFVPMGPAFALDIAGKSYRTLDNFIEGDPDLYPPQAMPSESWLNF